MLQYRWNLKTLCPVKYASDKRTNTVWFHFYEVSRVVKFIETENKNGGCQVLGVGSNRESLFNACKVSVLRDEKSSGIDGDGGCLTVWMYLMPLNCTLPKG